MFWNAATDFQLVITDYACKKDNLLKLFMADCDQYKCINSVDKTKIILLYSTTGNATGQSFLGNSISLFICM